VIRHIRILASVVLVGCSPASVRPVPNPEPVGLSFGAGLGAQGAAEIDIRPDGTCFGRDVTPAVIQTATAQELEQAEVRDAAGVLVSPAIYRSVIRQEIVRDRQTVQFETLCPPAYTASFVESLQRALLARGYYRGAVTGLLDPPTNRAIQDFQRDWGPDSPLLSVAAARRLGLVALTPDQIDELSGR
jgi:hypothetical protein